MKRALLLSILAPCAALAAPVPECVDVSALVEQWQAMDCETDAALERLSTTGGDDAAVETEEDDEPTAEADSQAYCLGGLMFDSAANTLIYLDRVWLNDERLQLSAEHRLYIKLRRESGAPAPEKGEQPAETAAEPQEKHLLSPDPVRMGEQVVGRAQEMPQQMRGGQIAVETTDAVADTDANTLLLTSPERGRAILVTQGRNSIRIQPGEGHPARLAADAQGNAVLSGAHISLRWVDEEGREGKMECAGGSISYHAATRTLYLPGHSSMEHPRGSFNGENGLVVVLQPEDGAAAAGKDGGYLSQFASMRFKGVESVFAEDGSATLDTYSAKGPSMQYNALTGACRVSGKGSFLSYGANTIATDGSVELHGNGDIDIEGEAVRVTYERASQANPEKMLRGSMQGSAMHFCAADGKVRTQGPLAIRDEELNFSCAGAVELTLHRAETPRVQQREGMPNLAVAQYDGVDFLSARNCVRLAAKSAQGDVAVMGDEVEADIAAQSATVTAREGSPLVVQGDGFRAAAETAAGAHSALQVTPEGEITLSGNHISIESTAQDAAPTTVVAITPGGLSELHVNTAGDITLQGADIGMETRDSAGQAIKAVCKEKLTLEKEAGRLTTGSATRMQSAQGTFAANGPVAAILHPGKERPAPQDGRFAHLNYNFDGVESATTLSGGSLRSAQGSMQCSGRIEVAFRTEPAPKRGHGAAQDALGGLKSARAEGSVALAGKDSSGRVLRATGDVLTLDAATGVKTLTGNTVTLSDRYNTHTASGGASITIDARNNARISGATQRTTATGIHEQIKQEQDK